MRADRLERKIWLLVLTTGSVSSCGVVVTNPAVRQEITVTVSTPDGIKRARTVTKAVTTETTGSPFPEANNTKTRWTIEAIPIDISHGEYIFIVPGIGMSTYTEPHSNTNPYKYFRRSGFVYRVAYFDDLNDPSTVHLIDPSRPFRVFGKEVSVYRILVAKTNKAAQCTLVRVLPWLKRDEFFYLDKSIIGKPVDEASVEQMLVHHDLAQGRDCDR